MTTILYKPTSPYPGAQTGDVILWDSVNAAWIILPVNATATRKFLRSSGGITDYGVLEASDIPSLSALYAALSHTHPESEVTNLTSDLGGKAVGAGTTVADDLVSFLDTAGKNLKDSGKKISDLVLTGDSRLSDSRAPTAHQLDGALHTVSGLTAGHFVKALTATTFGFAAHGLSYGDVGAEASGAVSSHATLTTGVHGVGGGTVAEVGDIATDTNLSSAMQALKTTPPTHGSAQHDTTVWKYGRYLVPEACRFGTDTSGGPDAFDIHFAGIVVPRVMTFDRIGVYIETAGGAGTTARLGVYNTLGDIPDGQALAFDAGTVDATKTGLAEITINQSLNPGVYSVAVESSDAVIHIRTASLLGFTNTAIPKFWTCWVNNGSYAALPSSCPTTASNRPWIAPIVFLRVSA